MGGLRPVVAVYSTFLSRAFDQINLDVGLHGQPVVFCIDRAGVTGDDGPSHHGVLDMVLFRKVPDMVVMAPSSYQELGAMLHDAMALDQPVAIRWPKTPAPSVRPDEVGHGLLARRVAEGDGSVCLIGVGKMLAAAEGAAAALAAEGVDCTVWDPRVVKPLDPSLVEDAARHRLVVTVEDGLRDGGAGTGVAEAIGEVAFGPSGPAVRVMGLPTEYLPHGKADDILGAHGLDAAGVAAEVRRCLERLA